MMIEKAVLLQQVESINLLLGLRSKVDRLLHQPSRLTDGLQELRRVLAEALCVNLSPEQTAALQYVEHVLSSEPDAATLWRYHREEIDDAISEIHELADGNERLLKLVRIEHGSWQNIGTQLSITEEDCIDTAKQCLGLIKLDAASEFIPESAKLLGLLNDLNTIGAQWHD
jgi:hypothetical protein